MADIEKVISKLKDLIRELKYTGEKHKDDAVPTFGTNINIMCYDIINHVECAIQTIRELQELTKGLSETHTSNPMYELGYKKGASDMEKAKQIIIDKLQEQNKWHLCSEELSKAYDVSNKPILEMPEYLVVRKNGSYDIAHYEHIYNDHWVINGMIMDDVIAWRELPKFEEVE